QTCVRFDSSWRDSVSAGSNDALRPLRHMTRCAAATRRAYRVRSLPPFRSGVRSPEDLASEFANGFRPHVARDTGGETLQLGQSVTVRIARIASMRYLMTKPDPAEGLDGIVVGRHEPERGRSTTLGFVQLFHEQR